MSHNYDCFRQRYLGDVTGAMAEYVERGGQVRFESDRSGAAPLEIALRFEDSDLYDEILGRRMAQSAEVQGWVPFVASIRQRELDGLRLA